MDLDGGHLLFGKLKVVAHSVQTIWLSDRAIEVLWRYSVLQLVVSRRENIEAREVKMIVVRRYVCPSFLGLDVVELSIL